jgi:membrane fusion protein (multidrug efflux system)
VNESDYKSSQDNYAASVSKINDIQAEKTVVQAEIVRLEALLDRHKLDVSYTAVVASYDGRMGRRTVEVGQMIDAGETLALLSIMKLINGWLPIIKKRRSRICISEIM